MNRIDRRRFTSGLLLAGSGIAAAGSAMDAGLAAGAGGLSLDGAPETAPPGWAPAP